MQDVTELLKQRRVDRALSAPPLRGDPELSLVATCSLLLGLTQFEAKAFVKLAKYEHVSRREMHRALSLDGDPTSGIQGVNVVVCRLRKKLQPYGIAIVNVYGQGYRIAEDSREKIRELLAAFGEDVVAAATPSTSLNHRTAT